MLTLGFLTLLNSYLQKKGIKIKWIPGYNKPEEYQHPYFK